MKRYFHRMLTEEYDEDYVHIFVDNSMATQCKKAIKQLSITELPKPILQNQNKHHTETDIKQEVRDDPESLKNELAENEPLPDLKTKHYRQVMHL